MTWFKESNYELKNMKSLAVGNHQKLCYESLFLINGCKKYVFLCQSCSSLVAVYICQISDHQQSSVESSIFASFFQYIFLPGFCRRVYVSGKVWRVELPRHHFLNDFGLSFLPHPYPYPKTKNSIHIIGTTRANSGTPVFQSIYGPKYLLCIPQEAY